MSDELINEPRPLLPRGRWSRVALAVVVVAAGVYATHRVVTSQGGEHSKPTAEHSPRPRPAPELTAGLFIANKRPASTRVTVNPFDARTYTLVVRDQDDGALGHRSAVVTYPWVMAPGRSFRQDTIKNKTPTSAVDLQLDGRRATVRGDLSTSQLQKIARSVRIVSGRPTLSHLSGYTATTNGTYGGCDILESQYESADLGVAEELGNGLVYADLTNCGSFEDSLFKAGTAMGPPVFGQPSAVSSVLGGNATLSWEVSPGLIGLVGYSGRPVSPRTIRALATLAQTTNAYSPQEWAATKPIPTHADPINP